MEKLSKIETTRYAVAGPRALPTYMTCTATKAALAAKTSDLFPSVVSTNMAVNANENATIMISLAFAFLAK